MLEVGKFYDTEGGGSAYVLSVRNNGTKERFGLTGDKGNFIVLLRDREKSLDGKIRSYKSDGTHIWGCYGRIILDKTITIDGKDITISDESFQELKKQLTEQ